MYVIVRKIFVLFYWDERKRLLGIFNTTVKNIYFK